jgi:hypothetical protein
MATKVSALRRVVSQGGCQLHGFGVAGEFFTEPQPQASQRCAVLAGKHQAQGPAQQQNQVQPEQTAQGPEHIHRRLSVAQGGKRQPGTADHGQQGHHDQCQSRALQPMPEGFGQPIALGQPHRAAHYSCR